MPRSQNAFSRNSSICSSLYARSVRINRERRKLLLHRSYCTSKRSSDFDVSKPSADKIPGSSIFSTIWNSVVVASSVLRTGLSVTPPKSIPIKELISKVGNVVSVEKYPKVLQPYLKLRSQSSDQNVKQTLEKSRTNTKSGISKTENEIPAEKESVFEQAAAEWITSANQQEKKQENLSSHKEKKSENLSKVLVSKASLASRSRFLVRSLACASSCSSQMLRLEEVCKHVLQHPQEKGSLVKEGLIRVALHLRRKSSNTDIQTQACVALSLLGYHEPPGGQGIRILSIDGGGTRGLMAIEILRQLQARTGKSVYEMFDYICGVSSGAILTFLMGGLRLSPDECETLYKELSLEVFKASGIWGAGRLMWYHAYYDTSMWVDVLRRIFGEKRLVDSLKEKSSPKLAAISAVMNLPALRPFVFRNYDYPVRVQSQFMGSANYRMWEAIRASGAAPGYFEEFHLDGLLHQDGGIMVNNPTALAIHEARLLWPSDYIQCVFSLGSGRFMPATANAFTSTTLKTKVQKIIDSATDTEAVHISMNDLLSPGTYFRFNPYLTEFLHLDENRPDKLHQLKTDAQMYLRRNEHKLEQSIKVLTRSPNTLKKVTNWLQLQKTMIL